MRKTGETYMNKVKVYQFEVYDVHNDGMKKSRRWGTRETIEKIVAGSKLLLETETEVDESAVSSDVPGLTEIGFNPHKHDSFQTLVKMDFAPY